jgi:hypothetical protein
LGYSAISAVVLSELCGYKLLVFFVKRCTISGSIPARASLGRLQFICAGGEKLLTAETAELSPRPQRKAAAFVIAEFEI